MRGVNPGEYRHRIALQEPADTQDPTTGEMVPGWTPVQASVPCKIKYESGTEFQQANARQASTTLRIAFRTFGTILPSWRVVWQGMAFDIKAVLLDDTAKHETTLLCVGYGEAVSATANALLDESGNELLDESGNPILEE